MEIGKAHWNRETGWAWFDCPPDSERTLVVAFGPSWLLDDPDPLVELAQRYPTSVLIGCSTAGTIDDDLIDDDIIHVTVSRFRTTDLAVVHERIENVQASTDAGGRVRRGLDRRLPDLAAMLVLSDGLQVNGSSLVRGIIEAGSSPIPVSGGLAGDGDRFTRSWVLVDGKPAIGFVTAVGLAGPAVDVRHGTRGGWDVFGVERRVTASDGNVLYELDGLPALALYKRYLGDRAEELPGAALLFPLALRVPGSCDRQVVRTILAVDEVDQSMTFAGDVPVGSLARLMKANVDRLIDGAADAARAAGGGATGRPGLAVAISCVGRRLVLGRRAEDELDAVRSDLDPDMVMTGFYSYGEISPLTSGTCDLHNQTMTITTIAEREPGA